MKYLLLFAGIIYCFVAPGQKNKSQTGPKQIFIGFSFSPDYDSRTLNDNGADSFGDQIIRSRNNMETGKFGYTTGLSFCIGITKLLDFETGIQYSNKGYKPKSMTWSIHNLTRFYL